MFFFFFFLLPATFVFRDGTPAGDPGTAGLTASGKSKADGEGFRDCGTFSTSAMSSRLTGVLGAP